MPCSQIQPRTQAPAHRKGKIKYVTNCLLDWIKHLIATAPHRCFFPSFPKTHGVNGAAQAAKLMVFSVLRALHLMSCMVLPFKTEKALTDKWGQGFPFIVPGIYLISSMMCLWIILLYKNSIVSEVLILPVLISKKVVVYCYFILNLLHHCVY